MDTGTACHDLREPGVIDETMIYNAVIEQGPKGEEGRLFKEQGIVYDEITYLRLEFLDILKIDHLWMMTGLTKLQLCNNSIETIDNLEMLVNLKELDLSFNKLAKIENLDALAKLEVLTLFQNRIQIIENIENLTCLTVFSIGNNKISDYSNVVYLRRFESLKSFNMAGNPICNDENFVKFIHAYLPQLVYYEYRLIRQEQKIEARNYFEKDLIKLEREELALKEIQDTEKAAAKQEEINKEAFVDYLGGDQLFLSMFEKDTDGTTLLQINEDIREAYREYMKNFGMITKELHEFGLQQAELRKAEIEMFDHSIGEAKDAVFKESRELLENFIEQKKVIFNHIKDILQTDEEDEARIAELSMDIQEINEEFQELCLESWHSLMKRELHLFEAMEEVNSTYERSLTELVNQFVEGAQAQFTQLRQLQNSYNETVTDAANKFITNFTVLTASGGGQDEIENMSKELLHIMQDREILMNALTASHDLHLLVIDQREDKLISGVRGWLAEFVDKMVKAEIERNRNAVIEINHFLDKQREELEKITASPLGLLLLPKEVQDVLQI